MCLKNHDLFVIPVIIDLTSLKFHEVIDVHTVFQKNVLFGFRK